LEESTMNHEQQAKTEASTAQPFTGDVLMTSAGIRIYAPPSASAPSPGSSTMPKTKKPATR
jgi:hypothetical protein